MGVGCWALGPSNQCRLLWDESYFVIAVLGYFEGAGMRDEAVFCIGLSQMWK